LLAEARARRGASREAIAAATGDRFDAEALVEVEAGRRPLLDAHISALVEAYGLRPSNPRARRTELVVDRFDVAGDGGARGAGREGWAVDVLCRYLGLIHVLRRRPPGHELALRQADLDVLAEVLGVGHVVVEERLVRLMANPGDKVGRRARRFERRVMVADAGILVAATTGGALVLEPRAGEPGPGVPVAPAGRSRGIVSGNVVPFTRPAGRPADAGRSQPLVATYG
jgi:hypothetical protein